ncbi:MAG: hypothetical protein E7345_03560 [Clostridiales bacterium]|nr:hypothetical protein [Clostridiales bacterium]
MSIEVKKYLASLEEAGLEKREFFDGNVMPFIDGDKHSPDFAYDISKNVLQKIKLPDKDLSLYLRRYFLEDSWAKELISNEIFFGRLYNALGVNALKYYPIILRKPHIEVAGEDDELFKSSYMDIGLASQDLRTVKGISVGSIQQSKDVYKYILDKRNTISKMIESRDLLLQTENGEENVQVLDNYIKAGLLDIICMMGDNHLNNKMTVGNLGKQKEDIISFDFENTSIDLLKDDDYQRMEDILKYAEDLFFGVITLDKTSKTYMDFLNSIKNMYEKGVLPENCREVIDRLSKVNIDEILRDCENSTGFIIPQYKKDFYLKLFDINQEHFAR